MFTFNRQAEPLARRSDTTSKPRLEALEERTLLSFFADGFEGPSLNSFWSTTTQSGSITFPSTEKVHSGAQSVQLNSTQTSQNKNIDLHHNFSQSVFGRVSVWMYDEGADVSSSNYVSLEICNSSHNNCAYVYTLDYDLGPGNGGDRYYYKTWGNPNITATTIDRTKAWHKFEINSLPSTLTMSVDGQTVYSGTDGLSFDSVKLKMSGPSWRPAFKTWFDDFEIRYRTFGAPMPNDNGNKLGTASAEALAISIDAPALATDVVGDAISPPVMAPRPTTIEGEPVAANSHEDDTARPALIHGLATTDWLVSTIPDALSLDL